MIYASIVTTKCCPSQVHSPSVRRWRKLDTASPQINRPKPLSYLRLTHRPEIPQENNSLGTFAGPLIPFNQNAYKLFILTSRIYDNCETRKVLKNDKSM